MPIFEASENQGTQYSVANIFTADNAVYWVPAIIGILLVLFLIYRYYYCSDTRISLKRY